MRLSGSATAARAKSFVEAWKGELELDVHHLWTLGRRVLVDVALALLTAEFDGFGEWAAKELRQEELERHVAAGTLPATTSGQAGRPCMDRCHISFKGYVPAPDVLQPHDHWRLYPVPPALAGLVINHDWEVSARIDWSKEPGAVRSVESVFVGLAGVTPRRLGPARVAFVRRVLGAVEAPSPAVTRSVGTYSGHPAPGRIGDTATLAIGWSFDAKDCDRDEDLVAAMALAARWAWRRLQDVNRAEQ